MAKGFYTKVVGTTFLNDDGSSRQSILAGLKDVSEEKPVPLRIELEPDNPYDKNAIKVCLDTKTGECIGYLSVKVLDEIHGWLREGFEILVEGVCLLGGACNFPSYGLNIWIERLGDGKE